MTKVIARKRAGENSSAHVQRKKERRRREILDAAAAIFAEHGYFAATMKDIADRLEMRPGSLYHYLESKETALEEICRESARDFCDRLQAITDKGGSCMEMVEQGIRAHLTADRTDYVVSFAFNRRNLPAGIVGELNDLARAYRHIWIRIFDKGRMRGEWNKDVESGVAADAVLSLCNGMATTLTLKRGREAENAIALACAIFLRGVAGVPKKVQRRTPP